MSSDRKMWSSWSWQKTLSAALLFVVVFGVASYTLSEFVSSDPDSIEQRYQACKDEVSKFSDNDPAKSVVADGCELLKPEWIQHEPIPNWI